MRSFHPPATVGFPLFSFTGEITLLGFSARGARAPRKDDVGPRQRNATQNNNVSPTSKWVAKQAGRSDGRKVAVRGK